jgi:PIN domain nuclease of toxin-antitoxin system
VLIDTQLLVWGALEPDRLPAAARRALRSTTHDLWFSLVSIWEVAIKTSLGRADFRVDPALLHDELVQQGFKVLPIRLNHLSELARLPLVHGDPFDRLLIAQAQVERVMLLTADRTLAGYGRAVKVV